MRLDTSSNSSLQDNLRHQPYIGPPFSLPSTPLRALFFCQEHRTPLHFASRSGREDAVRLLLSRSANVNARTKVSVPLNTFSHTPCTHHVHVTRHARATHATCDVHTRAPRTPHTSCTPHRHAPHTTNHLVHLRRWEHNTWPYQELRRADTVRRI